MRLIFAVKKRVDKIPDEPGQSMNHAPNDKLWCEKGKIRLPE
jgi:hypothetical protein